MGKVVEFNVDVIYFVFIGKDNFIDGVVVFLFGYSSQFRVVGYYYIVFDSIVGRFVVLRRVFDQFFFVFSFFIMDYDELMELESFYIDRFSFFFIVLYCQRFKDGYFVVRGGVIGIINFWVVFLEDL